MHAHQPTDAITANMNNPHAYEFVIGENRYTGTKFRYTDGLPIALELGQLVPELLSVALDQIKGDVSDAIKSGGSASGVALIEALGNVDLSTLGAPIARALGQLAAKPALLHAVLRQTYVNGQPLFKPEVRDAVFTANYGEAFKVLRKVIALNGWLPL